MIRDEDRTPATPPIPPGTPGELQPPARPVTPREWQDPFHEDPAKANRRHAIRAALLAGVMGGLGFLIPVAPIIFLLMLASGGLAVTFYTRRVPGPVAPSQGFRLGLLTGFFGTAAWTIFVFLSLLSPSMRQNARTEWDRRIAETLANAPDQTSREWIQRMGESFSGTGGLFAIFAIGMVLSGVFYLIIAGLGGMVGAALFGRSRDQR